jgi:hypothetical protein
MELKRLPFRAGIAEYERQADELLSAHRAADADAVEIFHHRHPRFLDEKIKWLPKPIPESEIVEAKLDQSDARLTLARWYDFRDWPALVEYAESVAPDGPVSRFEATVEAVIAGNLSELQAMLRRDPELVRARSTRVCCFDPPVHRATLLHYVAANGVEGYRQKTPANAVEIARALLEAGAEVDALADLYGGQWATMGLLVSSSHPAQAGVQAALTELLLDFGAEVDGNETRKWGTPLHTALAFGMIDAARVLERRGARVDLPAAAGLGRVEDVARLLAAADGDARHQALALAAQLGHAEIVGLLVDAGEDPNRFNPVHGHSTPLHQAAVAGHEAVVRLLVERGARLDIRDTIWHGTPLGWAEHGGRTAVADYLRAHGAE